MKTKISSKHFKDSNLDSDQNEESSSSSSSSSFKEDSILSQRLLPVKKTHKKKKSILKGFYVIEEILDKKKDIGGWKYKIKWMGYSINECYIFHLIL